MIVRIVVVALAVLALIAAAGADARKPARSRVPTTTGTFVDLPRVASTNLAAQHVTIWLPPGYARGRDHYPVIYMNDGQNAFFPKKSGLGKVWAADKAMLRLIETGEAAPAIIVAIWHPRERARTYFPQRLYPALPADVKAQVDHLTGGVLEADAYLRFVTGELKPLVDRRYRTVADREHTMIIGSSMGGLISLYAIAEYPAVFGAAACLSTHWPLVDPGQVGVLDPRVLAVWDGFLTDRLGPPAGRRIWFDHGDQTLDQYYGPWQSQIDARLGVVGWQPGGDFNTVVYTGAAHEENAWAARLGEVFTWLLTPRE